MSHRMYADFSDDAYKAFLNNEAVDNNGFRSKKGSFWPDQPEYSEIEPTETNDLKDQIADGLVKICIVAVGDLVFKVVIPTVVDIDKKYVHPYVCEKLDDFKEWRLGKKAKRKAKKAAKKGGLKIDEVLRKAEQEEMETKRAADDSNIVDISEYRKEA